MSFINPSSGADQVQLSGKRVPRAPYASRLPISYGADVWVFIDGDNNTQPATYALTREQARRLRDSLNAALQDEG